MADDELRASWERIEQHLRTALTYQSLPEDSKRLATEFIDHNELGVAFELVVTVLVERDIALDDEARTSFAAAAEEMNLATNEDWLALTGRLPL